MKALGLPLGFRNQTPYDLDQNGEVMIKQTPVRQKYKKKQQTSQVRKQKAKNKYPALLDLN